MKFNLYFGLPDGRWAPSWDNPKSGWFVSEFIPADERERMKVGDVYIDVDGDKWERVE